MFIQCYTCYTVYMTKEQLLGKKMGRVIAFRVNYFDNESITKAKEIMGGNIRRVTDADVIREGLKLIIAHKQTAKQTPKDIAEDMAEQTPKDMEEDDTRLTKEEKALGYQYLKGDLCDAKGFPVDQMNGDIIIRNGEVYATEPRKTELKQTAEQNMKEVIKNTEFGKANLAMEEMLANSDKMNSMVVEPKHSAPGMLTSLDGVDEQTNDIDEQTPNDIAEQTNDIDEYNFI